MKLYLVKYTTIGLDAGPFTVYDSTGAVVGTGITRAQLLAGYMFSINDTATGITIVSGSPCGNTTSLIIPSAIGYLNYPSITHLLTWVNNNQNISSNVSPAGSSTIGALQNYNIVYSGVVAGTQGVTVLGPSDTLGPFNGGGSVTVVTTQTVNNNWSVNNGATLNYGYLNNWSMTQTTPFTTTVKSGGIENVSMTNWASNNQNIFATINSGGIMNINGNANGDQTGYLYKLATTTLNGTVNLNNAQLQVPSGYNITGSGIVNIPAGSCFYAPVYGASSLTFNISGTGTGVAGQPDAALQFANNLTISSNINVIDNATLSYMNPFTYTGALNVPSGKILTVGSSFGGAAVNGYFGYNAASSVNGIINIAYGNFRLNGSNVMPNATILFTQTGAQYQEFCVDVANSVKTVNSTKTGPNSATSGGVVLNTALTLTAQDLTYCNALFNGTGALNITGGTLNTTSVNTMTGTTTISAGAGIGAGDTITGKVAALTFSAATSKLVVNAASGGVSKLNCTTLTATAFQVDLSETLPAGTYTILTKTAGSTVVPTLGVNNSGKSATFAWSGNNLQMTLV